MADANPTVGEHFAAKTVTDEQVSALVDAVLAGRLDDRAELAEGYVLDVAAAMKTSLFAKSVLGDKDSVPATRQSAAHVGRMCHVSTSSIMDLRCLLRAWGENDAYRSAR